MIISRADPGKEVMGTATQFEAGSQRPLSGSQANFWCWHSPMKLPNCRDLIRPETYLPRSHFTTLLSLKNGLKLKNNYSNFKIFGSEIEVFPYSIILLIRQTCLHTSSHIVDKHT